MVGGGGVKREAKSMSKAETCMSHKPINIRSEASVRQTTQNDSRISPYLRVGGQKKIPGERHVFPILRQATEKRHLKHTSKEFIFLQTFWVDRYMMQVLVSQGMLTLRPMPERGNISAECYK
jgi:hypothetical protein